MAGQPTTLRARLFAQRNYCTAVQHVLNIANDAPEMLKVCNEFNLASLNREPLGRGLLTGKVTPDTQFAKTDIRSRWNLRAGEEARTLKLMEAAKKVLTQDGHTLAQAALAWCLSRSPRTIPIPGFRNAEQVRENAQAVELGLLNEKQMAQIRLLFRSSTI